MFIEESGDGRPGDFFHFLRFLADLGLFPGGIQIKRNASCKGADDAYL